MVDRVKDVLEKNQLLGRVRELLEKTQLIDKLIELLEKNPKLYVSRRHFLRKIFENGQVEISKINIVGPIGAGVAEDEIRGAIKKVIEEGKERIEKVNVKNMVLREAVFLEEFSKFIQKYMYLCDWNRDVVNEIGKVDTMTREAIVISIARIYNVVENQNQEMDMIYNAQNSEWIKDVEANIRRDYYVNIIKKIVYNSTIIWPIQAQIVSKVLDIGIEVRNSNVNLRKIQNSSKREVECAVSKELSLFTLVYDAYSDSNKALFLRLAKSYKEKKELLEDVFFENFLKLNDYLEVQYSQKDVVMSVDLMNCGYLAYKYMQYMIEKFGEKHSKKLENNMFYIRAKETMQDVDVFYSNTKGLNEAMINETLEVLFKKMFTLIINEENIIQNATGNLGETSWEMPDYSESEWIKFIKYIEHKELQSRNRKVLVHYDGSKMTYECARDVYLYTLMLLYFVKSKNEREI